jgi:hypothetical protein
MSNCISKYDAESRTLISFLDWAFVQALQKLTKFLSA